jgi:hypothetical protein
VVALLALLVAASGAAFAAGSFTASDGTITACRDNRTGTLRVIDAASQTCGSKEMKIWWKDGITGTVADSDKLDNKDSSAFLGKNERAADSAMLGGQAPSAYGGVITGRINGVESVDSAPIAYGTATGISDATPNQSSVQTLSPGRDVVLRDFTVKLPQGSPEEDQFRRIFLVIDGTPHSIVCEIVGRDTTCTASPPVAIPIPAGSVISLAVVSRMSGSTDALFGYRLTTT